VVQTPPALPDPDQVLKALEGELAAFLKSDLQPREAALRKELAASPGNARVLNKLGVLYARFGKLAEARTQFEAIARQSPDVPALVLVNLGNIAYIDGSYKDAMGLYRRALEKMPESSAALLGLLLAAYEAGDKDNVQLAYTALKKLDPATASRYEYMATGTGGGRAASIERNASMWGDE
jgi:Flp pilus assembly protein TadD